MMIAVILSCNSKSVAMAMLVTLAMARRCGNRSSNDDVWQQIWQLRSQMWQRQTAKEFAVVIAGAANLGR